MNNTRLWKIQVQMCQSFNIRFCNDKETFQRFKYFIKMHRLHQS